MTFVGKTDSRQASGWHEWRDVRAVPRVETK